MFILKIVKVLCFDTLLQVFILKGLTLHKNGALIQVFILNNLISFRINTYEKHSGEATFGTNGEYPLGGRNNLGVPTPLFFSKSAEFDDSKGLPKYPLTKECANH